MNLLISMCQSPAPASGLASESALIGHLHHHLIQKLHIPHPLRLLVHSHDIRPLPLHFNHPPPQSSPREVQRHLHSLLALKGKIRTPFGLFCKGVLNNGDAGNRAAVLEDDLQLLSRGLVIDVLDEDRFCILALPLLEFLGVLLELLLGLHGVLPRGVNQGLLLYGFWFGLLFGVGMWVHV